MTGPSPAAAPVPLLARVRQYFADFRVLADTGREYWGMQLVNLLDSAIYFGQLNIASVFLSEDVGLTDAEAGYSLALFTGATAICLFFSGAVTDALGVRRATHVAMAGQALTRLGVAVVGLSPWLPYRGVLATALLLLMAPFMAMVQTFLQTANKRYTTGRSRSAGFSLWYLVQNIGAAAGGFLIDLIRQGLGWSNSHVFTVGALVALLCSAATVALVRTEAQRGGEAEGAAEAPAAEAAPRGSPWAIGVAVLRESAFWRLIVLILLIMGAKAVFAYNYLLMPKYWLRTIGEDAAIGSLQAINPILIVIGIVLFIPFASRWRVFSMLVWGAMISGVSLLALALPWGWLASDLATAHLRMSVLAMILLSVGEVVWSPKLYEYTAAIAPPGQEGTYLGISSVPWFAAKTLVSVVSGHLLVRFCPEGIGPRLAAGEVPYWDGPAAMWLWLGLYALAGCCGALLMRRWLTRGMVEKPAEGAPAA